MIPHKFESMSQSCLGGVGGLRVDFFSHCKLVARCHILCLLLTSVPSAGRSRSLVPFVLASFQELRRAKLPVIAAKAMFWTQDSRSRALQRSI